MNAIDLFLANVTDEFGNTIDFSKIENEGFNGIVCFGKNSAEISIAADSFIEIESDLSESEKMMLIAFVRYTQNEMKKQHVFIQNVKTTQKYL
jgi:hypothetical protein